MRRSVPPLASLLAALLYTRRFYFATTWTDHAGVSAIWAHRWW